MNMLDKSSDYDRSVCQARGRVGGQNLCSWRLVDSVYKKKTND